MFLYNKTCTISPFSRTTELMEDPTYIQFSSYWDEMITTGAVPLIALVYFNLRMILKIRQDALAKGSL